MGRVTLHQHLVDRSDATGAFHGREPVAWPVGDNEVGRDRLREQRAYLRPRRPRIRISCRPRQ